MIKLFNDDVIKADFSGLPQINLVVTSPPYNVGIKYDKHEDTMTYPDYLKWCEVWISKLFAQMPDDGRLCINLPFTINPVHLNKRKRGSAENHIHYPVVADYTQICMKVGFHYWRTVIWDKPISMKTCWGSWCSASAPFMRDPSEAILVFYKKQWKRMTKGVSTITGPEFMSWTKNVWKMQPETNSNHPAPFPPELPIRCIKLFSYKDDVVCDPFLGSGTCGDSAVRLERGFIGVEKSAEYFAGAKERIDMAATQTAIIQQVMPSLTASTVDYVDNVW